MSRPTTPRTAPVPLGKKLPRLEMARRNGAAKRRVKRPDFLANLERLGYSEKVGARMLTKFHNSLS